MTYTIEPDGNITAYATIPEALAKANPGDLCFSTPQELETAAATWPLGKLVDIWNDLPGVTPVKKFESRAIASKRIFARLAVTLRLDELESGVTVESEATTPTQVESPASAESTRDFGAAIAELALLDEVPHLAESGSKEDDMPAAKMAKKKATRNPAAKTAAKVERETKRDEVIGMLQTKTGASAEEIMKATGWRAHTVRGFIATLKTKHRMDVESFKTDAGRSYRISA